MARCIDTMQIFGHAAEREGTSASGEAMPMRKKSLSPHHFPCIPPVDSFHLRFIALLPFKRASLQMLTLRFPVWSPVSESQHKVEDLSQGLGTVFLVYVTSAAVVPT